MRRRLVAFLVVLLTVAALWLSLDDGGARVRPRGDSAAGGGAGVYARLLQESGRSVRVALRAPATADPQAVWIWFRVANTPPDEAWRAARQRHLKAGGTLVDLPVGDDLRATGRALLARKRRVEIGGRTLSVGAAVEGASVAGPLVEFLDDTGLPLVQVTAEGGGRIVALRDGSAALNRFVTERDHAPFVLAATELAGPGPVLFATGSFGEADAPGFLETVGGGAAGAVAQSLLLMAVVGWTLGRRFGLPRPATRTTRGTVEAVDVVEDVLRRAKR